MAFEWYVLRLVWECGLVGLCTDYTIALFAAALPHL